jgi:hypothetical protein
VIQRIEVGRVTSPASLSAVFRRSAFVMRDRPRGERLACEVVVGCVIDDAIYARSIPFEHDGMGLPGESE